VRAAIQINGVEADLHSKAALYELTTMHAQSSPSTAAAIAKVMSQQQLQQQSLSPNSSNSNNSGNGNSSNLLETQISSATRKLIKQLLRCLGRMRHLLTSSLELVFPTLCKLIHQLLGYPLATAQELLVSSIKILYVLSTNTSLIDSPQIASRVLHCVFEVISRANEDLLHLKENRYLYIYSLRFICSSACQLGKSFLVFDRVVCEHFSVAVGGLPDGSSSSASASAAVVNGIDVSTYHELIQDIKRGKPFSSRYSPDDDDDMEGLLTCEEMNLTPSSSTPMLISGATLGGGGATGGGVIGERSNDYSNEKNKDHFQFIQDSTLYRNNSSNVLNLSQASHQSTATPKGLGCQST